MSCRMRLQLLFFIDSFRLLFRKVPILTRIFERKNYFVSGSAGNDAIKTLLNSNRPFLVGRLGFVESAIAGLSLSMQRINMGRMVFDRIKYKMYDHDAFWPKDDDLLIEQGKLFIDALAEFDVYVCWHTFLEKYFSKFVVPTCAVRADFYSLEPFCYENPWSSALKGKKVLVICPFPETLKRQYEIREKLWADELVLPEFELQVMKSVYGKASAPKSETWFDALDQMYDDAMEIDFDVAILACGPFAVPLGCRFKRAGRSAITMCGVTQILFGIKGKRWDDRSYVSKYYNEYWVRPDQSEMPGFSTKVEKGCYL